MPDIEALVPLLLDWYAEHERDLPWRRDPGPWRVLVSETMLQQTRVAAVLPRYEEFLRRFPTPAALAGADEEEVLAEWSGLGYYRRARSLHAAARQIVERHAGRVPGERDALLDLPGVGRYTAGAVLSIAFGRAEPLVDGNVERILSRLFLLTGNVKAGDTKRSLWDLAGRAVRAGPPDRVNQAMMELGALVCLPRSPRCGECPLRDPCAAHRAGREDEFPELPPTRAAVEVTLAMALARKGNRALLVRHPPGDFLAGTWGPPFVRVEPGETPEAALARGLPARYGFTLEPGAEAGRIRHGITHHRITAVVLDAAPPAEPPDGSVLADARARTRLGLSALARKALAIP